MKIKGLSVLLSFVLVLMLTVSFSVPVKAANSNVTIEGDPYIFELVGPTIVATCSLEQHPVVLSPGSDSLINNQLQTAGVSQVNYTSSAVIPLQTLYGSAIEFTGDYKTVRLLGYLDIENYVSEFRVQDWYDVLHISSPMAVRFCLFGQERTLQFNPSSGIVSYDVYFDCPRDNNVYINNQSLSIEVDFYGLNYIRPLYELDLNTDSNYSSRFSPSNTVKLGSSSSVMRVYVYDDISNAGVIDSVNNQTDTLTSGFDSSSMSSSNTALSGSIAEFTGAESQITDHSFGYIDQVQFYDLNTQPQMLACITFCSSWLQSLFVNIGLWGILVMVSLSLGLGLMLIGWFKYRRK